MTSGTPKLTQAQFHTVIIDHYIIKKDVNTTVSVQQFLIALAKFPSCNCCGKPTDGTVVLRALPYCNGLIFNTSSNGRQGNKEAFRA